MSSKAQYLYARAQPSDSWLKEGAEYLALDGPARRVQPKVLAELQKHGREEVPGDVKGAAEGSQVRGKVGEICKYEARSKASSLE